MSLDAEAWWTGGELLTLRVGDTDRGVFVRSGGNTAGSTLTLLHGFPASSLEWAGIWDRLAQTHHLIAVDLIGFGHSEKPPRHRYRLDEQVELVLALWQALEVTRTAIVAYDYGAIITQLLINRESRPEISRAILLNASVFPELYRPQPIQRALLAPVLGALLSRLLDERRFRASWARVFGSDHPLSDAVAAAHWAALRHGDPAGDAQRRILQYIPERARRAQEITAALSAGVPLSFLWGLGDPVSGQPLAEAIAQRLPVADLVTYLGVGHAPHLEIPDQVASDVLSRLS